MPTQSLQATTNPYTASDGTQLDPTALTLARSIREQEVGLPSGQQPTAPDYTKMGDSNKSAGIAQWLNGPSIKEAPTLQPGEIPANFQSDARQYGLDPTDFSPTNQDKVLYKRIEGELKQGLAPSEIVAKQNGAKMINGKYVALNSDYANAVAQKYTQLAQQSIQSPQQSGYQPPASPESQQSESTTQTNGYPPPTPPTSSVTTNVTDTPSPESVVGDISQGNYGGAALKGASDAGNFLFPIAGDVANDIQGKSNKNFVQQTADAALSALPFIPFVGEAGEAIRGGGIAAQAGLGAATGGLQSVSQGGNMGDVLKGAGMGAVTGGALEGAGNLIGKLSTALPQSIIRKFIPGLSAEEAQYAASKPLGSLSSMLSDSNKNMSQLGSSLGKALKNPQYDYVQPSGEEIVKKILADPQLKDAGLSAKDIVANINSLIPLKKNLANKLVSGQDMTLTELHQLNSSLGKATFKRVFDDPTVRAGKDIGNITYHAISDVLKQSAPETASMFDDLSKEYALNAGLNKAVRAGDKARPVGLREIVSMMAGMGLGGIAGPIGGVLGGTASVLGEKALRSPGFNLKAAGLISKLGTPLANKVGTAASSEASRIPQVISGLVR